MKIAFLGQAEISKIVLEKLYNSHEIVCVVTNLDKESGRGKKTTFSPVKAFALSKNIPLLQFKSISKEGYDAVKSYAPDVLITASFGQILRKNILELASHGVINLHPSLLPKYRGSAPINWAIIQGEKTTGLTIMQTAEGIDNGDIILQESVEILPDETATELGIRLFEFGSDLLLKALNLLEKGKVTYTKQDETCASFFPKLNKEMGKIDFNKTAQEIQNLANGLNSWPLCFVENKKELTENVNFQTEPTEKIVQKNYGITETNATNNNNYNDIAHSEPEIIKVYKAKPVDFKIDTTTFKNGQVVLSNPKQGLVVKCKDGLVLLDIIQAPNSKAMPSKAYLNGKKIPVGTQF